MASELDQRTAMANAMINMMSTMGFGGQSIPLQQGSQANWEHMRPHLGTVPWKQMPWLSQPTGLDGMWVSNSGERLSIKGFNFRLDAGGGRISEGILQKRGRMLALHQRRINQTWIYEYAISNGRLALRTAQGQIYLYKRDKRVK